MKNNNNNNNKKKAEEALKEGYDKLSAILQKSPIPTAVGGADGSIVSFNNSLEMLIGYKQSEIKSTNDWAMKLYPDKKYRDFVEKNIRQSLAGEKQDCIQFTITCKDGSKKVIDFHTTFFKDGLIIQMIDITERKKAEEKLKKHEQQYRSLIENMPVVSWQTSMEGKSIYISPNVKEVYGYESAEILAKGEELWIKQIHPDDRQKVLDAFGDLFRSNKEYDIEYRIKKKDGKWIWLHDKSSSTSTIDNNKYAFGAFSDITEEKNKSLELEDRLHKLEVLNKCMTDRELKMVELKDKIKELEGRLRKIKA